MRGVLALLCIVASAAAVRAQEVTVGYSSYRTFGLDDLDGSLPASGELRVTIPTSQRFAIEPFVTVGQGSLGSRAKRLEGFYGVTIRQRVEQLSRRDTMTFVTYGVAGHYASAPSQPAGFGHFGPPVIGHFGFGVRRHLFNRVSVRPEIQMVTLHVVPIGARFVIGTSVDVGR